MTLDILYEDNHLIIVNKPSGLATQPTNLEQNSLETLVKEWIKKKYNKPHNVFLGVIHRLDKPVSGIVVFAKTSKALSRLNAAMRSRQMQKTYCALVEGSPKGASENSLQHYLKQGEHRAEIVSPNDRDAKVAILHYKILQTDQKSGTSLVEIKLETGRYHQIRAQFAAIGCPVVGDRKYGSTKSYLQEAIALHHTEMQLLHPVTGAHLTIRSPHPFHSS